MQGTPSAAADNAHSVAPCPSSHPNTVACGCVGATCDGSFIGSFTGRNRHATSFGNAATSFGCDCSALSNGGPVTAMATCSADKYRNLATAGSPANTAYCDARDILSRFCSGTTTATCPSGTTVVSCSCLSPWGHCRSATLEQTSTACSYTASGRSRSYARCGTSPYNVITTLPHLVALLCSDHSSSQSFMCYNGGPKGQMRPGQGGLRPGSTTWPRLVHVFDPFNALARTGQLSLHVQTAKHFHHGDANIN